MLEVIVLVAFAILLAAGLIAGFPLVGILMAGVALFVAYASIRGFSSREIIRMAMEERYGTAKILGVFALIGMLTAAWRASGTIPAIAALSAYIPPPTFAMSAFGLCIVMSMLTGSSFASAAIIGTVCMASGVNAGIDPALLGGAILAGSFVGDRCSPTSSTAILVSRITQTELNDNVKRMVVSSIIPLALSFGFYALLGGTGEAEVTTYTARAALDIRFALEEAFSLNSIVYIPAILIAVLAAMGFRPQVMMAASLASALVIAIGVQGMPLADIPALLVMGFSTPVEEAAQIVNGGGIVSMSELMMISIVIDAYSGLVRGTGLLARLEESVIKLSKRTTPFTGILITSLATSLVTCDQFLAISMTALLCGEVERDRSALALDLSNSAVLLSGITPWSTSCAGIFAITGAPVPSILFASFIWFVPLWTLLLSFIQHKDSSFVHTTAGRILGYDERDDALWDVEEPLAA